MVTGIEFCIGTHGSRELVVKALLVGWATTGSETISVVRLVDARDGKMSISQRSACVFDEVESCTQLARGQLSGPTGQVHLEAYAVGAKVFEATSDGFDL